MSSNSRAEVVPVVLEKIENSDFLSLVKVFGFTCVVNTEQWQGISKAIYIIPDTIVKVGRPEFSFLDQGRPTERIKVKKLRGVVSMGLLIPAPEGAEIGQDYWDELELERYEPIVDLKDSDCVKAPTSYVPKYDIDNFYRYKDLLVEGEPLFIQEKLHGENHRITFIDGIQYCGSRSLWKKDHLASKWWAAYYKYDGIKEFCEANPSFVLLGESYGGVKGFPYGKNGWDFAAFDIMKPDGTFLDAEELVNVCNTYHIPMCPIYVYDSKLIESGEIITLDYLPALAEGVSWLDYTHVREGIVIRPMKERVDPKYGRVILKLVGNGYYNKG